MTYGQFVTWSRAAHVVSLEKIPLSDRTPEQQERLEKLLAHA